MDAAKIAEQLKRASQAHFVFETNELNGVYDEQWHEWYADYLLAHEWNALVNRAWTRDELAATLQKLNQEQRALAPQASWIEYYAKRFAEIE